MRDDLFLHEGHLLEPHFDSQVASCHHHPVRLLEDALQLGEDLWLLYLRDHRDVRPAVSEEFLDLDDVAPRADERQGDQVDPVADGPLEVLQVLGREGRQLTGGRVRQMDSLSVLDHPADFDTASPEPSSALKDSEPYSSVIDQDRVARAQVLNRFPGRDGYPLRVGGFFTPLDLDFRAFHELEWP